MMLLSGRPVLWLSLVSALVFLGSLAVIPWLVSRLPEDYFQRPPARTRIRHPVLRLLLFGLRNGVGVLLVVGGLAMLVLPGQGILTLVIGLSLIDFPGRTRLIRRLVSHRRVRQGLNWIRARAGKAPLRFDGEPGSPGPDQ